MDITMPKNVVNENNAQTEQLIALQKQMAEHMLGKASRGYSHFSPIQKLRWADKTLNLVADYTCLKFGIDRDKIEHAFYSGPSPHAFATRLGNNGEKYGVAMSAQDIIRSNPISLFRVAFHEFRHIAQYDGKTPQKETISHYSGSHTKTSWGASPSEIGADKFSYKEVAALLGRGLLKSSTVVSALNLTPDFYYARFNNAFKHTVRSGMHKFSSDKYVRDLTKAEVPPPPPQIKGKVQKSEPGHFFSLKEIEEVAEGSYLFFKDQPIATKRQLKQKAQKVAESLNRSFEKKHNEEFANIEVEQPQSESQTNIATNNNVQQIVAGIRATKKLDKEAEQTADNVEATQSFAETQIEANVSQNADATQSLHLNVDGAQPLATANTDANTTLTVDATIVSQTAVAPSTPVVQPIAPVQ